MRFLTLAECKQFAHDAGITEEELAAATEEESGGRAIRVAIESERHRAFFLAKQVASLFHDFQAALMWVTDYGIWPSSENQHLYYRLRRAAGDSGTLRDAPGHLFVKNEQDDFVTFVHLALEFGWGVNILAKPTYRWVHASHDGWLRIVHAPGDKDLVEEVKGWSVPFEVETAEPEKPTRLQ